MNLKEWIADIPDFPTEGILFRDITPLLQNGEAFKETINQMSAIAKEAKADVIVGPESRGFIFGTPIAYNMGKPFVLVRKAGKLPCETVSMEYDLEYGSAVIEMHKEAIKPGQKVVLIDDLMATGGTIEAIIKLVESLGGEVVKIVFLMELEGLEGRKKLNGYDVETVIAYPGK
jgi:adenine phosphoribosyltransferase